MEPGEVHRIEDIDSSTLFCPGGGNRRRDIPIFETEMIRLPKTKINNSARMLLRKREPFIFELEMNSNSEINY
jgi:hypothetical protein